MMRVIMKAATSGRVLQKRRMAGRTQKTLSRLILGVATLAFVVSFISARGVQAAYTCNSWNPGVVDQAIVDATNSLSEWQNYANNYGPPEMLTDSYYGSNESAYIYPNNLTGYIPTVEPATAAAEDAARDSNACITQTFATSNNLQTKWKNLANSVTNFQTTSLSWWGTRTFKLANEVYCETYHNCYPEVPTATLVNQRFGDITQAYNKFYNATIYLNGDPAGDGRGRDGSFKYPTDAFRIWGRPRMPNTTTTMTATQFVATQNQTGNNGTVVYRNKFDVSKADYDLYQTINGDVVTGALRLQGIADDFVAVWVNGHLAAYSYDSGTAFMSTVKSDWLIAPGADNISHNEIKIILFDKYLIKADRPSYTSAPRRAMGSGMLWSLMYFPPKGSTRTAYCGTSTFPATIPVNKGFKFTVSTKVKNWGALLTANPPTLSYVLKKPGGGTKSASVAFTRTGPDATGMSTLTSNPIDVTAGDVSAAGNYFLTWTMTSSLLNPDILDCTGAGGGKTFAGFQPYFKVTGGDIWAGTPDDDSNAEIRSWNGDNKDGMGYRGAGSQIAALATGDIQNFISGSGLVPVGGGSGLSFSNVAADGATVNGAGAYGGKFKSMPVVDRGGGNPRCNDYCLSDTPFAGDVTTNGANLPSGADDLFITAENDVYINGNITLSYADITQIPHVRISGRNIYVKPNVTEIHGTFVADEGFYSCANYTNEDQPPARMTCNSPLKIYGSVAAKQLHLMRTAGNWPETATPAAEEFIYSPESWLNISGGTGMKFDSYVALPPIL